MTSLTIPPRPEPAVTLTRRQVEHILVEEMGWEPEDVTSFWFLARHGKHTGGRQ